MADEMRVPLIHVPPWREMSFEEVASLGCGDCGGEINDQGQCIDCGEWISGMEGTDRG